MGLVRTREDGVLGWIQAFSLLAFFLGVAACAIGFWIMGLAVCFISGFLYFMLYSLMQNLDERDRAKEKEERDRARKNEPPK